MTNARDNHGDLLRILGVSFGVAVAVGNMIGAGILRAPSLIAALTPDAGLIIALWTFGAVYVAMQANVLSELAAALPRAGGPYVYVSRAFGDVGGLAVGWTSWLSNVAGGAALSVSFGDFLGHVWPAASHTTTITAVGVLLVLFGMNAAGLRQGSVLQQATSVLKALALMAFCVAAFVVAGGMRHAPVAAVPSHTAMSWLAVVGAFQLIAGAYAGWEQPAFFAEETTNPGRMIPRAIGLGIIVTASLYVVVNLALLAALGTQGVAASPLPFTRVLASVGGAPTAILFAICAMVTVASAANASIMSAPRILLALARDGLLPRSFRAVNRGGSPHVGYAFTGLVTIVLATTGSFGLVFGLIGTLNAAGMILILLAYFAMRRSAPDMERPFRAVAHPWLPALALATNVVLFVLFLAANWLGAVYAVVLALLCVPLAVIARRARAPRPMET